MLHRRHKVFSSKSLPLNIMIYKHLVFSGHKRFKFKAEKFDVWRRCTRSSNWITYSNTVHISTFSNLKYISTFTIVFTEVKFTLYHALSSVPFVEVWMCLTNLFTSGSLSDVNCPTLTFIVTVIKVPLTLFRTCFELFLEWIGQVVSPAVAMALDSVGKALVLAWCPIRQDAYQKRY